MGTIDSLAETLWGHLDRTDTDDEVDETGRILASAIDHAFHEEYGPDIIAALEHHYAEMHADTDVSSAEPDTADYVHSDHAVVPLPPNTAERVADPAEHDLPFDLGTVVAVSITKDTQKGGRLVAVNEYGRPIVVYEGVTVDGRDPAVSFRTTSWDSLTPLRGTAPSV